MNISFCSQKLCEFLLDAYWIKLTILAALNAIDMKREHIVNQIRDIVHRVAPTAKTILYGSEARGDAREDSDIDLLVLLDNDKPTYDEENEVRWPLYELEIKTGVSINPYIISKKSWENRPFKTPFYVNVVNEGIVL